MFHSDQFMEHEIDLDRINFNLYFWYIYFIEQYSLVYQTNIHLYFILYGMDLIYLEFLVDFIKF